MAKPEGLSFKDVACMVYADPSIGLDWDESLKEITYDEAMQCDKFQINAAAINKYYREQDYIAIPDHVYDGTLVTPDEYKCWIQPNKYFDVRSLKNITKFYIKK